MVGANCLLYLNQSSPAFGISLNSISESTTHFPLRSQGSICLSMDCSQATFISGEQLVVSLRGGEIYVLTLVPDGMRGIRNILFEKAAAGILASCVSAVMCECCDVCVHAFQTAIQMLKCFSSLPPFV